MPPQENLNPQDISVSENSTPEVPPRVRKTLAEMAGIAPKLLEGQDAQEWVNKQRAGWKKREDKIISYRESGEG
jgi:hypothetical protein